MASATPSDPISDPTACLEPAEPPHEPAAGSSRIHGYGMDDRHAPAVRVVDALRLYATWDDDPDVGVLDCGEDAWAPFTSRR